MQVCTVFAADSEDASCCGLVVFGEGFELVFWEAVLVSCIG